MVAQAAADNQPRPPPSDPTVKPGTYEVVDPSNYDHDPTEEESDPPLPLPLPLPEHWSTFRRVPSEYLVEAKGDVRNAATLAGVDEASFLRALGSDDSVAQVARSAHFLTLMHSLDLVTLAKEEIARRFTELPDPRDYPDNPAYDPEIADPAASFDMKTLIALFKFGAEFIAVAANGANSFAGGGGPNGSRNGSTNRHTPPRISKIIEAGRGLPAPMPSYDPSPSDNASPALGSPSPSLSSVAGTDPYAPPAEAAAAIDTLAERLAHSPPEVQRMFQEALNRAHAAEPTEPEASS